MKPQSAKAKGRVLQQEVRNDLRKLGMYGGLVDGDIESIGMGQSGCDIVLSPAAKKVFPFAIECKNVEALNVLATFFKHHQKYAKESNLKLLIHRRNRTEAVAVMRWSDFLLMYEQLLAAGITLFG